MKPLAHGRRRPYPADGVRMRAAVYEDKQSERSCMDRDPAVYTCLTGSTGEGKDDGGRHE